MSAETLAVHDLDSVLDLAARRVVEHREVMGWGVPGRGALAAARAQISRTLAADWLARGARPYDVAISLASRVTDARFFSVPLSLPPRRDKTPATLPGLG
jgi:hypothetical protein